MKLDLEYRSRWCNRQTGPVAGFDTLEQVQTASAATLRRFLSSADALAGGALALTPLTAGSSTLQPFRISGPALAGHTVFAKVAVSPQQRAQLRDETQSAAVAAKVGAAPPVLARDADLLLTSFVDARALQISDFADDAAMLRVMTALVRLHRAGETQDVPQKRALDPQKRVRISLAQAKRLGRITSDESKFIVNEVEKASQALARMPHRPLVFTHGDFQHRNILLDGDRAWLIDFEDAGMGEPMTDVAHMAAEHFLPVSALPRLAALYCQASGAPRAETLTALKLCFHSYSLWRLLSRVKREPDEALLQARFEEAYARSAWLSK